MSDANDSYTLKQGGQPLVERRGFMKGLGALGALSLLSRSMPLAALTNGAPGLVFPLIRGPFQNNGATPWYTQLGIGTPPQMLKIALDTGSKFFWVTSTLCGPSGCAHSGGGQFDYTASSSFSWISQVDKPVSFGPWGTMTVWTGQDVIAIPGISAPERMYLSKSYSGPQFAELDWDGGIGLPSGSDYADPAVSFLVADLMNSGVIDPEYPYIAFETDYQGGTGTCRIGGVDPTRYDPNTGLQMSWAPYMQYPGVEYIWSTPLLGYTVGDVVIPLPSSAMFALDSGSSQFKGDPGIMSETLQIIASEPNANVIIEVGGGAGGPGKITVPPSVYNVLIEAGQGQGTVVPQFNPLVGLDALALVGSVLMDQFYTVFEYDVVGTKPNYSLIPVAMYLYQKVNGPTGLLTPPAGAVPRVLGPKAVRTTR